MRTVKVNIHDWFFPKATSTSYIVWMMPSHLRRTSVVNYQFLVIFQQIPQSKDTGTIDLRAEIDFR